MLDWFIGLIVHQQLASPVFKEPTTVATVTHHAKQTTSDRKRSTSSTKISTLTKNRPPPPTEDSTLLSTDERTPNIQDNNIALQPTILLTQEQYQQLQKQVKKLLGEAERVKMDKEILREALGITISALNREKARDKSPSRARDKSPTRMSILLPAEPCQFANNKRKLYP